MSLSYALRAPLSSGVPLSTDNVYISIHDSENPGLRVAALEPVAFGVDIHAWRPVLAVVPVPQTDIWSLVSISTTLCLIDLRDPKSTRQVAVCSMGRFFLHKNNPSGRQKGGEPSWACRGDPAIPGGQLAIFTRGDVEPEPNFPSPLHSDICVSGFRLKYWTTQGRSWRTSIAVGSAASWYAAAVFTEGMDCPSPLPGFLGSNPASLLSIGGNDGTKIWSNWNTRQDQNQSGCLPHSYIPGRVPAGEGWECFLLTGFCHTVHISLVCCLLARPLQKYYTGESSWPAQGWIFQSLFPLGFHCLQPLACWGFFLSLNPALISWLWM